MTKNCKHCQEIIPQERLDLLPNTEYCVKCAGEFVAKVKGYMNYSDKTAPDLVIIDPADKEGIRRAERAFRRER